MKTQKTSLVLDRGCAMKSGSEKAARWQNHRFKEPPLHCKQFGKDENVKKSKLPCLCHLGKVFKEMHVIFIEIYNHNVFKRYV